MIGQRFRITEEESFIFVKSGNLEVYAVTQEKSSFRQIFLMKLEKDSAAYPLLTYKQKIKEGAA